MKKPISRAKKIIEDLQKVSKIKPQKVSESYIEMVEFFPLRPITAKKQYEAALQITEHLINALNEKKADEGVEVYLQTLTHLISDYETKMYAALKLVAARCSPTSWNSKVLLRLMWPKRLVDSPTSLRS